MLEPGDPRLYFTLAAPGHPRYFGRIHWNFHLLPLLDGIVSDSLIARPWDGQDVSSDWRFLSEPVIQLWKSFLPCTCHSYDALVFLFTRPVERRVFLGDLKFYWVSLSHLVSTARTVFHPHLLACSKASTSSKLFKRYPLSLARTGAAPFAATCPLKASTTVYILDALPPKDPLPPGA